MANEIQTTQADVVIPEIWDTEILKARYAAMKIGTKVLNKSDKVKRKGDLIHVPITPKFAGGTVSATGGFTPEAQTITEVQVSVDTWKYVSAEITERAEEQSNIDLDSALSASMGGKLAEFSDADLAGLHSSLSTSVGATTTPSPLDGPLARSALLTLADANVPMDDLVFILSPNAVWSGIYSSEEFVSAEKTGAGKGVQLTGNLHPIFGTPVVMSTQVKTVAPVRKCMLLHREALALGMQINNRFSRASGVPNLKLTEVIVVRNLYGVKVVRSDHGVTINVKA